MLCQVIMQCARDVFCMLYVNHCDARVGKVIDYVNKRTRFYTVSRIVKCAKCFILEGNMLNVIQIIIQKDVN